MKQRNQSAAPSDRGTDALAPYFFHQGTTREAYRYLGVHREGQTWVFRVWAPNASYVAVVGEFCDWNTETYPAEKITEGGIWQATVGAEVAHEGMLYKFYLRNRNNGAERYKADPYGFCMRPAPETASVIYDIDGYTWRDRGWLAYRKKHFTRKQAMSQPLNIYELHAGSWMRHEDGTYLSYEELSRELAPYVKQMGYTHIELMPIAEHPFDGSWGYQVGSYYAPTCRYGTPKEFMGFVDAMHEAGIGVLLDWVPAHFPKDAFGLYEFDGQPLYEYQGADRMENVGWGTRCFDVGRQEVQSFLISNAFYWAKEYHIDGIRADAVAAMLYLDYDKRPGEWVPNVYGENKNLEAIAFFQKLNAVMQANFPDVLMIAEESTAWANITGTEHGGLGFTFKWNMGWMNDALFYAQQEPPQRPQEHHRLTFSLTYAFGENYILPISHDEVVHGKRSLLDRMPGDYAQKFSGDRLFLTYMMTHPGKKLHFMGNEIGQFREWDYAGQIEWFLLDYEMHRKFQLFAAELNHLYLTHPPCWEQDGSWDGFQWLDADNREQSIFSYRRIDRAGKELLVLLNFGAEERNDFLFAVPCEGTYEELLNSDEERFGGGGAVNRGRLKTEPCMLRGYSSAIRIRVPALSALIFRCTRKSPKRTQTYNRRSQSC